jgi:hypothetical protein
LNQPCALASDFELMLRAQRPKIVLQQYLPKADIALCHSITSSSVKNPE